MQDETLLYQHRPVPLGRPLRRKFSASRKVGLICNLPGQAEASTELSMPSLLSVLSAGQVRSSPWCGT